MTRKHFKRIAAVLNKHARSSNPTTASTAAMIADDLANVLAETNPNFDRERFFDAVMTERT